MKLDNEEITMVDRDIAKNYENLYSSDMRPNTSVGIPHYSNKMEELFPSDLQEITDENLKKEADGIKIEKDTKENIKEISEEVDTKLTQNYNKAAEIKDAKANGIQNEVINKAPNGPTDIRKLIKIQTFSNFSLKDKVISQVEYVSKNNLANNNKKVLFIYFYNTFEK
jgi:ubiquitin